MNKRNNHKFGDSFFHGDLVELEETISHSVPGDYVNEPSEQILAGSKGFIQSREHGRYGKDVWHVRFEDDRVESCKTSQLILRVGPSEETKNHERMLTWWDNYRVVAFEHGWSLVRTGTGLGDYAVVWMNPAIPTQAGPEAYLRGEIGTITLTDVAHQEAATSALAFLDEIRKEG